MPAREHHYALDAASLLYACRSRLRAVLEDLEENQKRPNQRLAELDVTLHSTERLLHFHLLALVESYERRNSLRSLSDEQKRGGTTETLVGTVSRLECLVERSRQRQQQRSQHQKRSRQNDETQLVQQPQLQPGGASVVGGRHGRYGRQHQMNDRFRRDVNSHYPLDLPGAGQYAGDSSSSFASAAVASRNNQGGRGSFGAKTRSPEDSLLFTLLVHLQLCMVRIEEADVVVCGYEKAMRRSEQVKANETKKEKMGSTDTKDTGERIVNSSSWRRPNAVVLGLLAGLSAGIFVSRREKAQKSDFDQQRKILSTAAKVTGGVVAASYVRHGWRILGINARLTHTTTALEDWQHQWVLVTSIGSGAGSQQQQPGDSSQLLELIEKQGSKSLVWHSYSALQFLLIKRTMDLLYASVGAALEMTKGRSANNPAEKKPVSKFWMPIATAAAATYYNVLGPSKKSAQIVSSSSQDFVKNAWGVVSLPAVKNLSLQASRILKGAAIADRIEIAGVPCVVLSSAPCPRKSSVCGSISFLIIHTRMIDLLISVFRISTQLFLSIVPSLALATALKRFRRQQERETSHLSTIMEGAEDSAFNRHAVHVQDYPKQNIILHMTGGGFFAHTLAGDLPYLLDWSRYTKSVIICPEYALLPEHRYPSAIDQTSNIYTSIVSGEAGPLLGFRPKHLIVTGEAAGGNLAAALCVKICMQKLLEDEALDEHKEFDGTLPTGELQCEAASRLKQQKVPLVRIPDGLMLSCPMLNMSLELTPSRVRGTNDPVLPSGLIKTISDSYLPPDANVDKTDPLASPFYASDEVLRLFPPTLICSTHDDPLLDDSVDFNTRLKRSGVESDLRAAHHMPHAFWGLSSAGFPEAKQVMVECSSWLQMHT